MAKDFRPFGDARHKIAEGQAVKSRDIYFALYQTMAGDENRSGLYLSTRTTSSTWVIVDECHRGSARDDSNWRSILEWFAPAIQLGMTAPPHYARITAIPMSISGLQSTDTVWPRALPTAFSRPTGCTGSLPPTTRSAGDRVAARWTAMAG